MESHRRLPHYYPEGKTLFLTSHLPEAVRSAQFAPAGTLTSGKAFVWMDRHLDFAVARPLSLRRREIAQIVVDGLYRAVELGHCELCAWVVMANHVHVLIEPLIEPGRLIKLVKGATAREAGGTVMRAPLARSEGSVGSPDVDTSIDAAS